MNQATIDLRQAKDAATYRERAVRALDAIRARRWYLATGKAPGYVREALRHRWDPHYMLALHRSAGMAAPSLDELHALAYGAAGQRPAGWPS